MSHRLVEHVGEVELELEAATEAGLFAEAAAAFAELVGGGPRGEPLRLEVSLAETEPTLRLVDWLNELVFLAEVAAFVPEHVEVLESRGGLRAELLGVRARPRHLVKAATLNGLAVSSEGGVWRAHVVLDV